jgi:hypothetical protein
MTTETETPAALCLHDGDEVAVMTVAGQAGQTCLVTLPGAQQRIVLRQDLPFGHKVALRALQAGEPVRKYGQAIGVADKAIAVGDHVHVHNLIGSRSGLRGAQHG